MEARFRREQPERELREETGWALQDAQEWAGFQEVLRGAGIPWDGSLGDRQAWDFLVPGVVAVAAAVVATALRLLLLPSRLQTPTSLETVAGVRERLEECRSTYKRRLRVEGENGVDGVLKALPAFYPHKSSPGSMGMKYKPFYIENN